MEVDKGLMRQLLKLKPEQWNDISTKMRGYFSIGGSTADETAPDDYLLEGIHYELRRRGIMGAKQRIPFNRIPREFNLHSAAVRKRFEHVFGRMHPAQRAALGAMVAKLLGAWMEQRYRPIPVGPKTLMLNIDKTFEVLDRAFPGYLESGLMSFVLPKGPKKHGRKTRK